MMHAHSYAMYRNTEGRSVGVEAYVHDLQLKHFLSGIFARVLSYTLACPSPIAAAMVAA